MSLQLLLQVQREPSDVLMSQSILQVKYSTFGILIVAENY